MAKQKQKPRALNVAVTDDVHASVKKLAVDLRISVKELVNRAVVEFINRRRAA